MIRFPVAALQLAELFVSSLVHMLYGFYIFSSAVAGDIYEYIYRGNVDLGVTEQVPQKSTNANDLPPIVLVHGIFGFGKGRLGGLSYFGGAEKRDERVFVPDLGSLTSIYDRARELFYYLKGGTVDYGEKHSKACGHSQFGRTYEQGHYPEWDEEHPIHFVGHSAGAQVVRVLQQMLADKAFKGYENTSENWVLSITALSGAFNGTTRTYFDGMQPEDGTSIKPLSLLQLCRLGVIVYDWLDIPLLKSYYNFGFDHFNISWKKTGILGLIDCLLGNTGPFASGDWIIPDLTIQGSLRLNSRICTFPNTYYFSYATRRTRKIMGITVPSGVLGIHPMLFIRVLQMSQWRHPSDCTPPYKGYRDEDWWDNDGALNTISMTHPHLPIEHPNQLVVKDSDCQPMQPGIWFYLCLWYKDDPSSQQKFYYYLARLKSKEIIRDSGVASSLLTRDSVKKIALALGQYNSFSRGFDKILHMLLASLMENSPVIRAKALRAVSIIVEADPEVLCDKSVQTAVEGKFCDSAISVREAALELVGRHIVSHPDVGLKADSLVIAQLLESIIFVIAFVLPLLRKLPPSVVEELEPDLKQMIVRHSFLSVVHACIN